MREYHKIHSIFKREQKTNQFIFGDWARPEFGYLANNLWVFTEKVDGTNIRVHWDGATRIFGGRTESAQIPATLIKRLEELFPVEKFKDLPPLMLCGEGYGAKIQSGGNYKQTQDFVLFDVLVDKWWLERENVVDIASKLGLDVVPIVGEGTIQEAIDFVRNGFNSTWGSFIAEGLVIRPKVELFARDGSRVITKIKHKDFKMPVATAASS